VHPKWKVQLNGSRSLNALMAGFAQHPSVKPFLVELAANEQAAQNLRDEARQKLESL
jgi:hypothetical protein